MRRRAPRRTRISDSDVFLKAAETGIGIFEMDASTGAAERAEFMPIVERVDEPRNALPSGNIIALRRPRLGENVRLVSAR